MGKSLYIKRLGEKLLRKNFGSMEANIVTVPLHGPCADSDILMKLLEGHMKKSTCCIYHIDISASVKNVKINYFLYSLYNQLS